MEKDWRDFKAHYGNIEGARSAFEKACETLFRKIYEGENVQQVKVSVGDGGIDIFIGEIGIKPITVIQCKFFLEELAEAQYAQIRNSFKKAKESVEYELKEWILCLPVVLDLEQNKWWNNWKKKKEDEYQIDNQFIKLKNGNELIDLLKEWNLYNTIFQITDSVLIKDTHERLVALSEKLNPVFKNSKVVKDVPTILFSNYTKASEPYYLSRKVDKDFVTKVKHSNIWLHGSSGAGKTALILRTVLQNNFDYLYCDFGPVDISSANDILQEVMYCLGERYQLDKKPPQSNLIKALSAILLDPLVGNNIVIILDEIAFPNTQVQLDFAKAVVQLSAYYGKLPGAKSLKFIVSTIPAPLSMIKDKGKASEQFAYISVDSWEIGLPALLNLLLPSLKISLSPASQQAIVDGSSGSPRLLKNILRKLAASTGEEDQVVNVCITEAKAEYF